jgi:hypothetical protein
MSSNDLLDIAGTVLWVIALGIMAGASRTAFRQIPKGVPVPMLWDNKHVVIWRAPRTLGLILVPAVAFFAGIPLLWLAKVAPDFEQQVIWFGVRATIAPLIAVAHLGHLRRAIQTLGAEGRLTP